MGMNSRVKYCELKEGECFKLNYRNDKRVYRREKDGSVEVVDSWGGKNVNSTYKIYPYLDMIVYRRSSYAYK